MARRPTTPRSSSNGSDGDLPKDAFAKVRYAVFGCGNSDWAATYQSVPRMIDEQLAAHGARSVYARGEGDARSDLDGQFEKWFAAAAPGGDEGVRASTRVSPAAPTTRRSIRSSRWRRPPSTRIVAQGGVAPMKVLVNSELQNKAGANPSDRSTRHIEVQLPPGITYRVGDHLSVVPRNDPALVDSVARRFGFLPADQIRLQVAEGRRAQLPVGDAVSVGRLLTEFVELQQVATRKQIQIMSEHTRCPVTKPKLLAYVGDDAASAERYRSDVLAKRKSVFDLLEEHPACELPFHAYLEMLSLLAPRYYSISSSPSGDPARCSVTVGVVRGARQFGTRRLQGRLLELSRRPPRRRHHPRHRARDQGRLPPARRSVRADDHDRPRHGAGAVPRLPAGARRTARRKGAKLGPAMLFFGCRHPEQDFLYADELKAFAADGITELHTAFSRADGPKTYVQHLVAAQKDRVWSLIEQGAIVYVCGDGGKMEPDVKAALVAIYREKSGADADAGLRWIDDLGTKNRYVLDVWAGG